MPHKFTLDSRIVYGWCASDALMFPVILAKSGVVESSRPVTGRPIRVGVNADAVLRVDPPEAVVSPCGRPKGFLIFVRTSALWAYFSVT